MRKEFLRRSFPRERGVGLILVLLSILILAVLTAGIVLTAGREVYSSYNYRIDSQSLYAAEAGLQKGVNWFKNTYTPASASSYNLTVSPVRMTTAGTPIVKLDGINGVYNYPVDTTITSFQNTLVNQTLATTAAITPAVTRSFSVSATLRSARSITVLGVGPTLLERWLVTSRGRAAGGTAQASVEVTRFIRTLPNFAALACGTGPASMTIGNTSSGVYGGTDSYDSSLGAFGTPPGNSGNQGDIASNGQVVQDGGDILGNAFFASTVGTSHIIGTQTTVAQAYDCSQIPLPTGSAGTTDVVWNGGAHTMDPTFPYRNITCSSACTVTIPPGTYNINSMDIDSNSTIIIPSPSVVLNIYGTGSSGLALYWDSGTTVNNSGPPSNFVIFVNSSAGVTADSATQARYVIVAPNSQVVHDSNTAISGLVIARTLTLDSGARIHYDVALRRMALSISTLTNTSWDRGAF